MAATRADHCTLTIGGKKVAAATHAIVIPDQPTSQEKHAALELQQHLRSVLGEQLPVVVDAHAGNKIPLVVGKSALLAKLGVDVDFKALGLEGIRLKAVGPALLLAGNRRGVLYAVSTFLEDSLHCHWLTPDCTVLPKGQHFVIKDLDKTYVPPLEQRALDYPNTRDGDWAMRNRINGDNAGVDEARGGKISYRGFVHTFNSLAPPEKYYAEHPEYYSEIGGKRIDPGQTQLCCTNPDVIRIATETVRQWMKESPEATVFSVSQNDLGNYCQCANCQTLAEREGSQIAPILHLVNAVADAVRDEHPDKIIDTLAYQYGRRPPTTMRPRPNVVVRLCSIECCFVHPLESDPFNASFVTDIQGWSQQCNRLWVWDYVINYAHSIQPFPNLYVLRPNINFFLRNGVTGIYEESNYYSKGGELAELRSYIMAKTLWDPSYDTDKAIGEFLPGYYGAAAGTIREYLTLVHRQNQEKPDLHVGIYASPNDYLPVDVIEQAAKLFDKAEAAVAGDATHLHRVQVARLPILYSQIMLEPASPQRKAWIDRFEQIARAEGVTDVGEGRPMEPWLKEVRG